MDENNVIETTVQEATTTATEPKKATITVALAGERSIDVNFSYEITPTVINRAITDADTLVGLLIDYKTTKKEEYNERKKTAYNTAIAYLVNFNVNLLEYTEMNEEFNVVYDAIAIARAVRNFIIQKSEEEKTEVID